MIVTSIKQAKKNIERVNLFLDEEYWTSITKDQLAELGLHKGQEITPDEKESIEKAHVDGKLLEKVLKWLSLRPRSEKETLDYLQFKRGIAKSEALTIIDHLYSKNYLDDTKFAKWYVTNRVEFGLHGPNKIRSELFQKGITGAKADKVISKLCTQEKQLESLHKYFEKRRITELDDKLIRKLMGRGFNYDVIKISIQDK